MALQATLLRYIAAQLHVSMCLTVAQEKFGKSLFELTPAEVKEVSEGVISAVTPMFKHFSAADIFTVGETDPKTFS